MSNADTRIINTLPTHPKTIKLIRRHGQAAGWNLIRLLLFVSANRPDGDLTGMTSEDIEIAADWQGAEGQLTSALIAVGFLDEVNGGYEVHDWSEHNPWAAGSGMRSAKARWNAIKRHHGEAEACRLVPEYRPSIDASSNAGSTGPAVHEHNPSNAPTPSPSPNPSPTPEDKAKPKAKQPLALSRFADFWMVYPKKENKLKAQVASDKYGCDAIADEVIAGAKRYAASKVGEEKRFVLLPTTWLNGHRWTDAETSDAGNDFGVVV